MGWSGGTEIFDEVADEVLNIYSQYLDCELPMYRVLNLLSTLKSALEDNGWDTQNESNYWGDCKIGQLLGYTLEEDNE